MITPTVTSHMITPTVTEIPRTMNAVSRDTFIGESAPRSLAPDRPPLTAPASLAALRAAAAARSAPVLRAA